MKSSVMMGVGGALISNLVTYINNSYPVIVIAWVFNAAIQFCIWLDLLRLFQCN